MKNIYYLWHDDTKVIAWYVVASNVERAIAFCEQTGNRVNGWQIVPKIPAGKYANEI